MFRPPVSTPLPPTKYSPQTQLAVVSNIKKCITLPQSHILHPIAKVTQHMITVTLGMNKTVCLYIITGIIHYQGELPWKQFIKVPATPLSPKSNLYQISPHKIHGIPWDSRDT